MAYTVTIHTPPVPETTVRIEMPVSEARALMRQLNAMDMSEWDRWGSDLFQALNAAVKRGD